MITAALYYKNGYSQRTMIKDGPQYQCYTWDCCAPAKFQLLLPPPRATFPQSPTCAASGQGSVEYLCDIDKQNHTIRSWGDPALPSYGDNSPFPSTTKFESVAIGASHSCGVLHGLPELFCWGANQNGQSTVPDIKLGAQGTCKTEHPDKTGPVACTSCLGDMHFTIVDPKTNSGTCTTKECAFCKPSACCGARHKHFVINTESLEGICVRHNDDCTPVCMPRGDEPQKRRVCSKGCNQMLKVAKSANSKDAAERKAVLNESQLYDIIICQSDKRVICDPAQTLSDGDSTDRKCVVKKEVEAVGRCVFNIDLWNLGGTCIANHLHKHELEVNSTMKPQCPDTAYETIIDTISDLCQLPVNGDSALCTPLAMAF